MLLLAAAPVSAQPPRPRVILVVGDDAPLAQAARGADLPVDLWLTAPPSARAEEADDGGSGTFASVRAAYVDAELERCLAELGPETREHDALGEGRRELAARLAFWRAACAFAAGDRATAARTAERMAALRLPIPSEVELASPELERLLADAFTEVRARPPVEVRVEARRAGAAVGGTIVVDALDRCAAPCALSLAPGEHIVRFEGPGSRPLHVVARWPREPLVLSPEEASPELAGAQWSARVAAGADPEDRVSLTLLAQALRARRLVWLAREPGALRGALVVDGLRITRAAREGGAPAAEALLRDLLERGRVIEPAPPLWRRPGLWVGVILAAAGAATVAALVVREPRTRTEVGF